MIGAAQLTRPGYSVDEEFTVFAVRGIAAHGLPLLPSGLLYDRGIAYSYASWMASWLPGDDLAKFRAVGLLSSVAALLIIGVTLSRRFGSSASLHAMLLIAVSIPFWAVATTGRFYGPFLLTAAAAVLAMERRSMLGLIAAAMICRWTHELAFTLGAIPAFAWWLDRDDRRYWLKAGLAIFLGLLAAQAVIFAVHYSAPSSGETMIRRFFLWQLLNILQRPPARQFGIALAVLLLGLVIAPRRSPRVVVVSLCIAAAIAGQSLAQRTSGGWQYPLDMFWFIARLAPITLALTLTAIAFRIFSGREWPLQERGFHIAWVVWVVAFGMADAGITLNYVLVPIVVMLTAIAIDLHSIIGPRNRNVAIAVVIAIVAADQWRHGPSSLADARPTIHIDGIEAVRDGLESTDRVACTDELACLMLVGRVDNWLALDDYVRERFVVEKVDGARVGVYAGAPAVFRPADLFAAPDSRLRTPGRILIIDVFKEYAVGNSRTWLPRALALDGIEGKVLLETPQARVVQISSPERNASFQPMR